MKSKMFTNNILISADNSIKRAYKPFYWGSTKKIVSKKNLKADFDCIVYIMFYKVNNKQIH